MMAVPPRCAPSPMDLRVLEHLHVSAAAQLNASALVLEPRDVLYAITQAAAVSHCMTMVLSDCSRSHSLAQMFFARYARAMAQYPLIFVGLDAASHDLCTSTVSHGVLPHLICVSGRMPTQGCGGHRYQGDKTFVDVVWHKPVIAWLGALANMTVLLSDLDVSIRGDVFADVVGGHGTSSRGQGSSSSSGSSATPTLSFVCEESCPNSGFMVINPTSARRQADAMRILYAWSISKSSPNLPAGSWGDQDGLATVLRPFLGPNGPEEERRYNGKAFWYTEPIAFTSDIGGCLNYVPSGDYLHSMRYLLAGGRTDFWPSYDGCKDDSRVLAVHYNGFHHFRQKVAAMRRFCDHPRDFRAAA